MRNGEILGYSDATITVSEKIGKGKQYDWFGQGVWLFIKSWSEYCAHAQKNPLRVMTSLHSV